MTPTVQTEPTTPLTEEGSAPLAAALSRFQSEMPTVPKTKTADTGTYRYSYADLADITSAALPLLTAQGLSFATCPRYTEHGYELVGVLLHESGESMEGALPIHGSSAQQLGSAITYARRYLFGCMTGVVTDDDDDGRSASGQPARAPRKKAAAAREPASATTSGGASVKQVQKIAILMGELGLNQKAAAQQYVANVIGRHVESRTELNASEAHAVIEALQTRGVETPVGSTGGEGAPSTPEPHVEGPTGPPGPVGPEAEYRFAGVEEHLLPEPPAQPSADPFAVPPPVAPPPPPARINASALARVKAFLKAQMGDIATPAEEAAMLTAILGYPVKDAESLSADEGQRVAQSLYRFGEGTLRWEFDRNDTSPTPAIIIDAPPAGDE